MLVLLLLPLCPARADAAPPTVSAQSAIVMDAASGRVLYEKNAEQQRGMASTTKIMTAIVALEYGSLSDTVKVSAAAAGVEGSSMYLSAGEEITLESLLYGLMLVSGNDAAAAIAEHVGGTEAKFVELMNQKAKEIGAENTHFDNPHGLSTDTHYTTARDLAKITAYGLRNPKFAEIVSTKSKQVPWAGKPYQRQLTNHNKLLSQYQGCIGVKTGFTKATGRCLVSAAERDNLTLVCVTLNAPDDWNDHTRMLEYAFQTYHAERILTAGQEMGEVPVTGGTQNKVKGVIAQDCYFPLTEEESGTYSIIAKPLASVEAPVRTGDEIGKMGLEVGGTEYFPFPVAADLDVQRKRAIFKELSPDWKDTLRKVFFTWATVFSGYAKE